MFLPKKNHTNQWQIFFSTSKSAPIHVFWTIGSNRTTYARDHPANSITEQDDENIHVRPRLRPECSPLKLACARRSFFWIWWADREHACAGRAGEELIVQQVVKGTVIRLRPLMERGTVCFTACGALALSTQWCFIWANGGECRSGVQDLVGITMSCHTPLPAPTLFIHLYPGIRVRLAAFCAIVDVLVIVSKDENVNEGRCVSIKNVDDWRLNSSHPLIVIVTARDRPSIRKICVIDLRCSVVDEFSLLADHNELARYRYCLIIYVKERKRHRGGAGGISQGTWSTIHCLPLFPFLFNC
jgi:hypothetical protein